jgi:predicted amidophosphoribosyltransferase
MLRYLYCCHFCGRPLFRKSFICAGCLFVPTLKEREQFGLKHFYLYEYNEYGEVFIKNFKYGFFQELLEKVTFRFPFLEGCVIALPNSKNTKKLENHSYTLAKSIFRTQDVYEPFEKISDKQAEQSMWQRSQVRLKKTKDFKHGRRFILVDDLVTTGKTIESAWRKLGCPPNTVIFSLCYTPKKDRNE